MRWLKAEFMHDRIGEEFDGVISGVTEFGIFVELLEIYVDGLVHVTALDNDYFHFDPRHHRLLGERTRKIYRLSDPVRVRVVRVDLEEAKIDFELVHRDQPARPRRHKSSGVRAKSGKPRRGNRRRKRN
jgi:ribonuclease R